MLTQTIKRSWTSKRKTSMEDVDLRFRFPFSCVVSAPSNSGKTNIILDLLLNAKKVIDKPIYRVVVVYSNYQKLYEKLNALYEVFFVESLDECNNFLIPNTCVIIDDRLDEINKPGESNTFVSQLFTRRVHHEDIAVIVSVQLLFPQHMRCIFNNATYLLLGKWIKNKSSIATFGKQFSPLNYKYFLEAYEFATKKPYHFLLVDLHMQTNDCVRLRSGINPYDPNYEIYVAKNETYP